LTCIKFGSVQATLSVGDSEMIIVKLHRNLDGQSNCRVDVETVIQILISASHSSPCAESRARGTERSPCLANKVARKLATLVTIRTSEFPLELLF
jgi:hypothetical protein